MGRHTRHHPTEDRRHRILRALAVVGIAAAAVSALVGVSTAAGSSGYSGVGPVTILKGVHLAAYRTSSPVVLGGSTAVPSDANSVQLSVSVSGGAASGTLYLDPAGRGHVAKALTWTAGQKKSATVDVAPGIRNEVTFYDSSSKPVVVTASITGYENAGVQGPPGVPGPPGKTGDTGPAAIQYFARLAADGTLVASSPTVDPNNTFKFIFTGSTGQYAVGFTKPIALQSCVATVTVVDTSGIPLAHPGYAAISYISSVQIGVSTYSTSGQLMDSGFDLLMEC